MDKYLLSLLAVSAVSLFSFGYIQWPLLLFVVAVILYLHFSKNKVLKIPIPNVLELSSSNPTFSNSDYLLGTAKGIPAEMIENANKYRDNIFVAKQMTHGESASRYTANDLKEANWEAFSNFSIAVVGLYIRYNVGFQFIPVDKLTSDQKEIFEILQKKHIESFKKNF